MLFMVWWLAGTFLDTICSLCLEGSYSQHTSLRALVQSSFALVSLRALRCIYPAPLKKDLHVKTMLMSKVGHWQILQHAPCASPWLLGA